MRHLSSYIAPSLLLGAALSLAGCGVSDIAAPVTSRAAATAPSFLLQDSESWRPISDTTDAAGNHVMIAEHGAGVLMLTDTTSTWVGSVTIRTSIPPLVAGSTSAPCITSTILKVETIPGWSASVKKPGGCDKEIIVQLSNAATRQRAQFQYLYVFGKTRIDYGLVR